MNILKLFGLGNSSSKDTKKTHVDLQEQKQNNSTMKIEQIYTGCLAQGAYYITSGNEAAIIDPLREVAPYLERLQREIGRASCRERV